MPTTVTEPLLPPHDPFGEQLIVVASSGIFKFVQDTGIEGVAKMACVKIWGGPEEYPSTVGEKIFPDTYFENREDFIGHVVYDRLSDRIFFYCTYDNYNLDNVLYRVHKLNIRTGEIEAIATVPNISNFKFLAVSENRVFVECYSTTVVLGLYQNVIHVLDKATLASIAVIPIEPYSMIAAISDTELICDGTTATNSHYVTVDENALTVTNVRSYTASASNHFRAYIKPLQRLLIVVVGARTSGQYVGKLWDPLTGASTDVGLLALGLSAGDTFTIINGGFTSDYTRIDGTKVLIQCNLYKALAPSSTTTGAIELDTQTGEIKYYGFHVYRNGNSSNASVGTLIKPLYPTYSSSYMREVEPFMYGTGGMINAYAFYWTYDNIGNLHGGETFDDFYRLLSWNRADGRSTLTYDHYPDSTKDIIKYGNGTLTLPQVFLSGGDFSMMIKVPAVTPSGLGMTFNTTPPPSAVPIARNGVRYLSQDLNIPRDEVKWLAVEHDGISDTRLTYESVDDRQITSADQRYSPGYWLPYVAHLAVWTPTGRTISYSGAMTQVPIANDWDHLAVTIPAAYPAGTYYACLIPAMSLFQSCIYSDYEFAASTVGVQGDTNLRLRVEHLTPAFSQILPTAQPPVPSPSPTPGRGAAWLFQFESVMVETSTLLGWPIGTAYYFRAITDPLNSRTLPMPFTLVSFTDDGTKSIADLTASIEAQLSASSLYITPFNALALTRHSTFTILDGQADGDTSTRMWTDAMAVTDASSWVRNTSLTPYSKGELPLANPSGSPLSSGTIPFSVEDTENATVNTENFVVSLTAGQVLVFGTVGVPGTSSVPGEDDTYIRLKNPLGVEVDSNDDIFSDYLSKIAHRATMTGNYTMCIGGYANSLASGVAAWQIFAGG